jgi:ABC-2 type transport system ATP-binding protein
MTLKEQRISEVKTFLINKDLVLGYRKLMDCGIDTQNLSIFESLIKLTDWKEQNPTEETLIIEKSIEILKTIEATPIKNYSNLEPIISCSNLEKSYGKNRFKLGPISLDIKKGQVYGLVGENGNGKTTLLRILAKELSFNSGKVHYNFSANLKNNYNLRSKLVYIPQRTEKWYGSLKDNLKFVLSSYGVSEKENETRVLMMIARMGLWNYKHLKWRELSSGYKMRFELARTLLRQPEVLLLDEPLANLDVLAQQIILEDLKSICNSLSHPIALILSSQQLYEVEKVSDNVIFLKNGKYKDNTSNSEDKETQQLIIELDSDTERHVLETVFEPLQLEKLLFNGGIYIGYFNKTTSFSSILKALGEQNIKVTYVRDISYSTRRFFV